MLDVNRVYTRTVLIICFTAMMFVDNGIYTLLRISYLLVASDVKYIVVANCWTCLAAAAVRRRWVQLRPSSGNDANDCSAWGAVPTFSFSSCFPRCCSDRLGR